MKLNKPYMLLGGLLLLIGSLVYLIDRPPGQTYFVFSLPFNISLYNATRPLFGTLGNYLPHLLHTMAFIFLTAGLLNWRKKGNLAICLFWLAVNAGFELAQKFSTTAAGLVPDWFDGLFILENTKGYFLYGTYCRLDMAAIIMGSVLAYVVLIYNTNRRRPREKHPEIL